MVPRKQLSGQQLVIKFAELADERTWSQALGRISTAMKTFEGQWEQQLADWPEPSIKEECEKALRAFRDGHRLFERGIACLNRDPQLATAFRAANHVFNDDRRRPWALAVLASVPGRLPGHASRGTTRPRESMTTRPAR